MSVLSYASAMRLLLPTKFRSLLAFGFLAVVTSAGAAGQTVYLVDDDGGAGVDFLDIQPAVDAASPGDRIDVRAGTYSSVLIQEGITLMGEADVVIMGSSFPSVSVRIEDIPANETVVVTDVELERTLVVFQCDGHVLIDNVASLAVSVAFATNTSLQDCTFGRATFSNGSFVQLVSCTTPGGAIAYDSTLVIANSSMVGYSGGEGCTGGGLAGHITPGDGGPGLELRDSTAWCLRSTFYGGAGGGDECGSWSPGSAAHSIHAYSSSVITSGCTFGTTPANWNGAPSLPNPLILSGSLVDVPDFPAIDRVGASAPLSPVRFDCFAGSGTSARLFVGRRGTNVPLQAGTIPLLHSSERGISLGPMPTSGVLSLQWTVPALPRGTLVYAQLWRTLQNGSTERSNGVTLVVR